MSSTPRNSITPATDTSYRDDTEMALIRRIPDAIVALRMQYNSPMKRIKINTEINTEKLTPSSTPNIIDFRLSQYTKLFRLVKAKGK